MRGGRGHDPRRIDAEQQLAERVRPQRPQAERRQQPAREVGGVVGDDPGRLRRQRGRHDMRILALRRAPAQRRGRPPAGRHPVRRRRRETPPPGPPAGPRARAPEYRAGTAGRASIPPRSRATRPGRTARPRRGGAGNPSAGHGTARRHRARRCRPIRRQRSCAADQRASSARAARRMRGMPIPVGEQCRAPEERGACRPV